MEGFHDELKGHVFDLERDRLCQVVPCPDSPYGKTSNHIVPDQLPPGSTRTMPSGIHQDGGVKYATGASWRICGRDNITIGTWNTRTLRAAGKLLELTHEMDRY